MPRQSRGFWVCSYCERAFDQYQDAEQHEASCTMVAAVVDPLPAWQQQQQQQAPPSSQQQQQQRGQPPPPRRETPTTATSSYDATKTPPPPPPQQQRPPQPQQRYLPLMGSQEPSHLNPSDTLACRSTEVFEVTNPSTPNAVLGQVGLRCAFCAETSTTASSFIFPNSIHSVGDSLRHSGFEHLAQCPSFPEDYKRQIQEAIQTKRDVREERRALADFCTMRCQQAGIVDRHPMGMFFSDSGSHLIPVPQFRRDEVAGRPPPPPPPPPPYSQYQHPYPGGGVGYGIPPPPPYAEAKQDVATKRDDDAMEPTPLSAAMPGREPARMPPPPTPPQHFDFPFFYEQNRWACKYCAHLPPQFRDPQYFWANHAPPPTDFVEYHLSICREFQRTMMYEQQQMQRLRMGPTSPADYSPYRETPTQQQRQRSMPTAATPRSDYPASPQVGASPYASSVAAAPSPFAAQQATTTIVPTPLKKHSAPASSDGDVSRAVQYLESNDLSKFDNDGNPVSDQDVLVLEEDRLLLTEYFFYLMKQLRLVRFSEADRRTRGGKREKIKVGYGGLQCVHCVDVPNTRKFFWSNVDRLANSFAEIPGHVLKCRRCPQPAKDALLLLKQRHAEQMARLPRGSQKVFFRRMWRRLHDQDPVDPAEAAPAAVASPFSPVATMPPSRPLVVDTRVAAAAAAARAPAIHPSAPPPATSDISPTATSGSEESVYFLQRPAAEAAKALLDASMQTGPPTPTSRVLLAIPEDKEWLSDTDCFIRRQLEVFCATSEDLQSAAADRKYPVKEGQVGIRCIHCALTRNGARGPAVAYPFSISGIYEAAREFQRMHLENCENLPLSAKTKLVSLKGASSLSSVLRKYFVLAAKALGLQDTVNGIRAGAESVPLGSQAAYAFSEIGEEMKQQQTVPRSSQKRKAAASPPGEGEQRKRPATAAAASSQYDRMSMLAAATSGVEETKPPARPKRDDDDDPSPTEI